MVLGKLPVPGRPTNLDISRAMAYRVCDRCGCGCLDIFLSSSFSSSLGEGTIETKILCQRAFKQTTAFQPTL